MGIKVVSEGGAGYNTRFLNAETGEDIGKIIAVGYGAKIVIDHLVKMEAEIAMLHGIEVDVGETRWMTKHPVTGDYQQLASMTFRDGTEVRFKGDGTPYVVGQTD